MFFNKYLIGLALALLVFSSVETNAQVRRRRPVARKPSVIRPTIPARKPPMVLPTSAATTTPSGLTFIVTEKGGGKQAVTGETVVVHYTGVLTDGTKFDSSRDRNETFEFQLGAGKVIKGWDEGIARLKVGDKAILIIPPELGYGARGAGGVIPPNATLVFFVELVDVKPAGQ